MKMFAFQDEDLKCGGCNWRVSRLYVLANSKEEAEKLFNDGIGLCGNCMSDMLSEDGYEITLKKE